MPPRRIPTIPSGKKKLAKKNTGTPPAKIKPRMPRWVQVNQIARQLRGTRMQDWDVIEHLMYKIYVEYWEVVESMEEQIQELKDAGRRQEARLLKKQLREWKKEMV
jgi:hypothetical protein